jgi:DNA primase
LSRLAGHSDIDRVRDATDLVRLIGEHVVLKPRGREHVGLCPFHDDRTPSMAVVTHKGNAFYKCFACGAGGDAFDFVMNYHKMDFGEALRHLAQKAGITLTPWKGSDDDAARGPKRIDVRKANAFAATFFRRMLNDETVGAAARQVIAQRGISDEQVAAFMLGAAPDAWDGLVTRVRKQNLPADVFVAAGLLKPRKEGSGDGHYDAFRNRVMFPICDELGNPIAFGARKINPEDEPKYLNSAESAVFSKSKTLYGLHLAKRAIIEANQAIITEGYTDVIACHQAGFTNVVATLGTSLTQEHAQKLSKFCDRIVMLFDGDAAGQRAGSRGSLVTVMAKGGFARFIMEKIDVHICILPDDLDPDELLKLPGGVERFREFLNKSVDIIEFLLSGFRSRLADAQGMSGRQRRLEEFLLELSEMGLASAPGLRQQMVLSRIAELVRLPISALEQAWANLKQHGASSPITQATPDDQPETAAGTPWDESEVSRPRRMAEFELLAVAIYEPAMALRVAREHAANNDSSLFDPARYHHPASRALAGYIAQRFADGETFTVQQLLAALEDEADREIASRLYFDGRNACGERDDQAMTALHSAISALESAIRREHLHEMVVAGTPDEAHDAEGRHVADPLQRLQEFLRHRGQAGHIAAAIPRGVRT